MEKERKPKDYIAENVTNIAFGLLEKNGENESLPPEFLMGLIVVGCIADHDAVAQQLQKSLRNGTVYHNNGSVEV
jgi:hypothetical protein